MEGSEIEALRAENAELKERLAKVESAAAEAADLEKKIAEKMTHGLSRNQAIAVINRQAIYDAQKDELLNTALPSTQVNAQTPQVINE